MASSLDHPLVALARSRSADASSRRRMYLDLPQATNGGDYQSFLTKGHSRSVSQASFASALGATGETLSPGRDYIFPPPDSAVGSNAPYRRHGVDAARIWKIYLEHAEKPDNTLVETWKEDMNGVLIFAGLFSQVVTAFLIDSYKTVVKPDSFLNSGDNTGNADGSTPHAVLLAINACWFLSLVFLLLSALTATLVQQWARTYSEVTRGAEDILQQARLRTSALLGVKKFGMQAAVKSIPVLLHLALWLFLGGLAAFLFQVYNRLAEIILIFFAVAAGIYFILSILPAVFPDCPYNTPLTTIIWYSSQLYRLCLPHSRGGHPGWSERKTAALDAQALRWTITALSHDDDFVEFFSLLPKLVRPGSSSELIDKLLFGPDRLAQHLTRILHSIVPAEAVTDTEREERETRAAVCLRTICLLARVACNQENIMPVNLSYFAISFYLSASRDVQSLSQRGEPGLARLARFTEIMLTYRALCNFRAHLKEIEEYCTHRKQVRRPQPHFYPGYLRRPLHVLLDGSRARRIQGMVGAEWTAVANELQNQFQVLPRETAVAREDGIWLETTLERVQRMLDWSKRCFCVFFFDASLALRGERELGSTAADILDTVTVPLKWPERAEGMESVEELQRLLDDMIHDAGIQVLEEDRSEIVERYLVVQS